MTRGRLVTALLVPAALLLSAAVASAQTRRLGRPTKVENYGYSLRLPEDWASIPAQPGVTKVVGGWKPDIVEAARKGDLGSRHCEVEIVRYPIKAGLTGGREQKQRKKEERKGPRFKTLETTKNIDEYLEVRFDEAEKRFVPKKITAGRGKNKLIGELMEFTYGSQFICGATFRGYNYDWGVFYRAHEEHYKKEWERIFKQSIESFRLFEPEGDVTIIDYGDASKLTPEQRREQIKSTIAGNPGWWALDTENYVFLTNSRNRGFIKQLGRDIEVIREKLYEELFPPSEDLDAISIVRVFSDEGEYYLYGGPGGSAGYWSSAKEELVLFDNFLYVSKAKSKEFTKGVLYHEAFHQYIYYAVGDVAPHSWFNEGHGDFFAGHLVRGNRVKAKMFDWRVDFLNRHLAMKKGLIPIRSLVRLPQREYYTNGGLKYSQGWAFIYFLRNVTRNEAWSKIPERYFAHLRDNVAAFKKLAADKDDTEGDSIPGIPGVRVYSWEDREKVDRILSEAVDKGFEGVDYEELDREFQQWVESIT